MKSFLYYVEPTVELGDSLFRLSSVKSILLPEIKSLKDADPSLDIKMIVGEHVYQSLVGSNQDLSYLQLIAIKEEDLLKIYGEDFKQAPLEWYRGKFKGSKVEVSVVDMIRSYIPHDFSPDLIMSYEAPAPFLKVLYPSAVLLNCMFGAFSRAPFASMLNLDPVGLFGQSFQAKYAEEIKKTDINNQEKALLKRFRREAMKSIASYMPVKTYLDSIASKFDAIVLVGCQIDGYFAFDGCVPVGTTQFSMVEKILSDTPANVGVLVTEHTYRDQFSEEQLAYLKNKYSNFVHFDGRKINSISQYIIPYIDGVVTVSSSIAYQAALWKKPLFVFGQSQLNFLAYSKNYKVFLGKATRHEQASKDKELYYILSHMSVDYRNEVFLDGAKYYSVLKRVCDSYLKSNGGFETFGYRKSIQEMEEMLISNHRNWLLKKESESYKDKISPDHLRISFSECKVVSFDLFDTLAERDFAEPHELFLYIEPKVRDFLKNKNFMFHYFRRQAENDTRRPTRGEFEVTLDQIYDKFMEITGLSKEQVHIIKDMELAAELALVQPKKKMIKEYNFSSLLVDKRSVITDIYLDDAFIKSLLKKIRVNNYDSLWISAETKTRKHNGTIYPEYIGWVKESLKLDLEPSRMLHVGDNATADGEMAKKFGMRTYVFPKAMDNFKQSKLGSDFLLPAHRMGGISTSILTGMFANKFYSAHWNKVNDKSMFFGDPYQYGYTALGSLVLGFVQWLYHRAKLAKLGHLYFLARDGWILKQAYDTLYADVEDAPKSYYLYCSRRAVMSPSIISESCIHELASQNFNARSIESFLDSRYGLQWDDKVAKIAKSCGYNKKDIVSPYYEQPKLREFLKAISTIILEKSKEEREDYVDYLNSLSFVKNAKENNAAVVDIGYSGSMQMYLKKMLGLDTLAGYYYLTHHHSRDVFRGDVFEGFLQNLDDHKVGFRHPLNDHVFVFESALSSTEGSLLAVKGRGKNRTMIFLDAEEEERRKHLVMSIHQGAADFVKDFSTRFGAYRHDFEVSPLLSSSLILKFASQPTAIDAKMFVNFEVENVFGGGSVCLIAEAPKNTKLDEAVIKRLIDASKWKPGAKVLYSPTPQSTVSTQSRQLPAVQAATANLIGVSKISPPLTTLEKAAAILHVPLSQEELARKRAKLARSPYQFFADSSSPALHKAKEVFNEEHRIGRLMSTVFRKLGS